VCAASLAACSSSSSTPTTTVPTSTTQSSDASSPTTTYRGAPAPASGLTAAVAARWACAYFTALAPDTGEGAHPNVARQAMFDSAQVEKYAGVASAKGGSPYSALDTDAQAMAAYAASRAINWSDPESFWNGKPPNDVATDCRALVNTTAPVAP